ncbi:unnamed protein product [Acanthoscelides obtectus]|uniref:Rho-GAP domain-containing protein n=1 Tax=Acanthoscelides obtectus TaxID=200917 RepID=A0A9P0MDP7_ACAOB|nr:unnamed protein product [Acanthoscelides obtectus]CAK1673221.1 Rho GTPase-activating protein 19 [Acanthoscelides obtectus]
MCSTIEDNDDTIVAKFKKDYTEQFYILIRMHLSFLLDLNTNENDCMFDRARIKKWHLVPFAKKSKTKTVINGVPLSQENVCQMHVLIEFLKNEEHLKNEGIFRRTGSLERQQELKRLISNGMAVTLESGTYNVHDCASVLKSFLAELVEPLLTDAHFPTYCQISETYGTNYSAREAKLLEILQLLVLLLPPENRELLGEILSLLNLTASFQSYNKMDTDNLAKLFMPHLLCPRNLSPEVLLKGSQKLFGIISFMIKKASELFKVPQKLVLDFRAKYEKKKVLSPTKRLNESISDTASTVFTFVDQERTAKENESNPTETALAQLYAHIQSLPESSKKRKLVKQFNKENGNGTPCQILRSCAQTKNRSLGDVIKRRIFQKNLANKRELMFRCSSSYEIPQSPPEPSPYSKTKGLLFCHRSYDSSEDLSAKESPAKKLKQSRLSEESSESEGSTFRINEETQLLRTKLKF